MLTVTSAIRPELGSVTLDNASLDTCSELEAFVSVSTAAIFLDDELFSSDELSCDIRCGMTTC